ncbi:MAG: nucleotidyltransferase domain-containing protein [Gammaproteobacteria bacterium]|nr:MAG: nucleotidyltransferase domain-containing protein [Gammaproteobacteria bacterium]
MLNEIIATLKIIESQHQCTVLFACESGSRAWGFASPDSDFDVRFIYVNPLEWYLKLEDKADTINKMLPNDLDLCGWDLQKALRLFAKCNICLNEWLNSPCIYYQDNDFYQKLKALIPLYFNPKKAVYHYLSTVNKTVKDHLQTTAINIKKLFYILRPLLACIWIINKKSMPPTMFKEVLFQVEEYLPSEIIKFIHLLLAEKSISSEKHTVIIPQEIIEWIHEQASSLTALANKLPAVNNPDWDPLNALNNELICIYLNKGKHGG